MKTKRTVEMIIEVERVRVICRRDALTIRHCGKCRTETDFVAVADAAQMLETDAPPILRLIEADILHSLFNGSEIFVCLVSLLNFEAGRVR